jgi:hypothetical protein
MQFSCSLVVSSKEDKKEKGSRDRFVNVCLRLWLTCPPLSACCYWRLYLCRSQEWAKHSPSHSVFVYLEFSWVLLHVFPCPSTLGRWRYTCFLQLACLFTVHVWVFPSPLLQWSFPHTATVTSFPTPVLVGQGTTPAFSSQLVYLQFC